MYQKKRNERFFQNFVLIGICALVLLGGCSPIPYPASAPMSPISPLPTEELVVGGESYTPNVNDMANLLKFAEPFACEYDTNAVLHCAANAVPFGTEKFPARIYVKVPPQKAYPDVSVVLLPILPPVAAIGGVQAFPIDRIESYFEDRRSEKFKSSDKPDHLDKPDPETGFMPSQLITNFAVVKVDENGEFSGKVEDALSEFDPAIEVRFEFNQAQLKRAANSGLGMPRFGYWSYAPEPKNRKWIEFTPAREHDNRALLEIFQADKAVTLAERGTANVGILEFIEEAATVDQALELLKQPSNRDRDETGIRAIEISDPTGLYENFDQFSNAATFGFGEVETRVSFVVTVSSWEDQAIALFP